MFKYYGFALVVLSLLLAGLAPAQVPKLSTAEDIERDVKLVPCKSAERLEAVKKLFLSTGAEPADIAIDDRKGTKNLVVTKKGSSAEVIIVGAHYDKLGDGCGAIDNWTGIVAIAHLYGSLRSVETSKTFKFVAFDKEEKGMVGSGNFVSGIPKEQRAMICSMVNVDSVGVTLPWVMENTSDKILITAAKDVWKKMNMDLKSASLANADADSSSFKRVGIPAITFIGLDANWQKYLHSSADQVKNIKIDSVYAGYKSVLPFLVEIDKAACDAYRKK